LAEKEVNLYIKCAYDPQTKELKCFVKRDQWDEIEKLGGIKGIRIVHEEVKE